MYCILYCFMGNIREGLNSVKEDLNNHITSRSKSSGHTGRLSCMYHLPYLYDKQDCMQRINKEEIEKFNSVIGELASNFTPEFSEFTRAIIPSNIKKIPKTLSKALNLCLFLLENIDQNS